MSSFVRQTKCFHTTHDSLSAAHIFPLLSPWLSLQTCFKLLVMSTLREKSYKEIKIRLCHSEFKESNLVYYQPWITKKLEDDENINEICKDTKSYIKINEIIQSSDSQPIVETTLFPKVFESWFKTVAKSQVSSNNEIILWLLVSTLWGTVLKGHSIGKGENQCSTGKSLESPRAFLLS